MAYDITIWMTTLDQIDVDAVAMVILCILWGIERLRTDNPEDWL
jgi:hypothetical protein